MNPGDPIDRYVIERVLGEGGMSVVYLARHNRLRSLHAIKVLRIEGRSIRDRLLIEGRVQASLKHPNVVSVTDVIEDGDRLALVMEYVDGPTLFSRLDAPMPTDVALELFRGMVAGVGAAHAAGLVHRDLKPANVLLASTNIGIVPKVTDFGLVKVVSEGATRSGVMMGTPNYMSPEQVRDASSVDHRSDLWSLGVLLYEMLTASTPFGAEDHLTTYNRIASADRIPIRDLRPDLPDPVVDTVDRMLRVDLNERIGSASEVLEALFDDASLHGAAIDPARFRDSLFTPGATPVRDRDLPGGPTGAFDAAPEARAEVTYQERPVPRRQSNSVWLWMLIGLGVITLGALVAVALTLLGVGTFRPDTTRDIPVRDVDLDIANVAEGVDVAVWVDDATAARRGAGTVRLAGVPAGEHTVRWAAGHGCGEPPCPEECTTWCTTGESSITVGPGDGVARAGIIASAMPPRTVTLRAPIALDAARLDEVVGRPDGGRIVFDAVQPGRHLLTVSSGSCTDDSRGCSDDPAVACPSGCSSVANIVTIPASTQPLTLDVDIDAPGRAAPNRRARAPARVTGDDFRLWIDANPQWQRETAIDSGRVNRRYLRNWTPSPPGGAVTLVTFEAAMAYCQGRGGVRALEDTPQLWTGAPDEEWRSADGVPAALTSAGGRLTGEPADRAAPERGFRCAR